MSIKSKLPRQQPVAGGTVSVISPLGFTANDCLDFGGDLGSPVSRDYFDDAPYPFNLINGI